MNHESANPLLLEYAATRDPVLREQLTIANLPLVKFVARKMVSTLPDHVELDDIISWGALGLIDAIDKFDPSRGLRFSTYAVTRIRGAILDGLQKMDWAPKQVTSKVRHMKRAREALWHELGREPTIEELAILMDATEAEVRGWCDDQRRLATQSLSPSDDEGYRGPEPVEAADQEIAGEVAEIRARVCAALGQLDGREQEVFLLYYREGLTLREVAERLGMSASSAIQIHTRLVEGVRTRLAAMGGIA